MIVWINGAFGSGKSSAAYELQRRLKSSFVYDPEHMGYFLRENEPPELYHADFQDRPLWRTFNYEMIKNIAANYAGILIVPMTVTNEEYFHEMVTRLRRDGFRVDRYVLSASAKTLIRRGRSRFCFKNAWSVKQIPRCIKAFESPIFEKKIDTDSLAVSEVVERLAGESGLVLMPEKRGPFLRWLRRKVTQIKHIKL